MLGKSPRANYFRTEDSTSESLLQSEMQKMQDEIVGIFRCLLPNADEFDEKSAYNALYKYIDSKKRILYSPLSNIIYDYFTEKKSDEAGTINSNVEKLVDHAENEYKAITPTSANKDTIENTYKACIKIWDHVNLAQQQYHTLKQSDAEYKEKFQANIADYKQKMTEELNSQLLTLVSIFTALAFLVFGGITSLDNIFSTTGIPLLKILIICTLWSLGLLNLIFIFLYCVSKMTALKFRSTDYPQATIYQKYPVVWWTNLVLCFLLAIFSWLYFIRQ